MVEAALRQVVVVVRRAVERQVAVAVRAVERPVAVVAPNFRLCGPVRRMTALPGRASPRKQPDPAVWPHAIMLIMSGPGQAAVISLYFLTTDRQTDMELIRFHIGHSILSTI